MLSIIDNYRYQASHREIDVLGSEHKIVTTEKIKEIIKSRDGLEIENCTTLYNNYWTHPKELKYKALFKFWKSVESTKLPVGKLIVIEPYGNIIIDVQSNVVYYNNGEIFDYFLGFQFYDIYSPTIEALMIDKNRKGQMLVFLVGLYYGEQGYDVQFDGFNKDTSFNPLDLTISNAKEIIYVGCYYQKTEITFKQITSLYGSLIDKIQEGGGKRGSIVIWSYTNLTNEARIFANEKGIVCYGLDEISKMEKKFDLKKVKKRVDQWFIDFIKPEPIIYNLPHREKGSINGGWNGFVLKSKDGKDITIEELGDINFAIIAHGDFSIDGLCVVYYEKAYEGEGEYGERQGRISDGYYIIKSDGTYFTYIEDSKAHSYEDEYLGSVVYQDIQFINGIAVVFNGDGNALMNYQGCYISEIYSKIMRANNYFVAYNTITLKDGRLVKQRYIVNHDGDVKVVDDINIPKDIFLDQIINDDWDDSDTQKYKSTKEDGIKEDEDELDEESTRYHQAMQHIADIEIQADLENERTEAEQKDLEWVMKYQPQYDSYGKIILEQDDQDSNYTKDVFDIIEMENNSYKDEVMRYMNRDDNNDEEDEDYYNGSSKYNPNER